ncbi:MAG: hypothetical protein H7Z40_07840 [Phycisphaerae bacterium]|nr:hypothetical protein [Gemmatimonadaceae bacterium]
MATHAQSLGRNKEQYDNLQFEVLPTQQFDLLYSPAMGLGARDAAHMAERWYEHTEWRRKLQAAYAHGAYANAKRALQRLVRELAKINESAARSLEEGLEETLTLHRLALHADLGEVSAPRI